MKRLITFAMLSVTLTLYGQNVPYSNPSERKAIKTAYEILKLYYPLGDLCFSDSIYDQDWFFFEKEIGSEICEEQYKEFLHKTASGKPYDDTIYSSILYSVFGADACECRRYVAEFTAPYKRIIKCEIVPSHDRNPYFGEMPVFLFKFNEKGEIYQFFQTKLYLL